MFRKFVMNEDGFWVSDCEQLSWVALARKLTKIHHEDNIPICYIDSVECRRLDKEQDVEDRLLCHMKFSNRITINDNVIMIFDWIIEENKEDMRKMSKEFTKSENDIWACGCERLTNMGLVSKLIGIHIEADIPIYLDSEDTNKSRDFRIWELIDGTLLKYVCNSNYITIKNGIIKIFDNEEIEEKDDDYIDILEAYDVTLETTPEEFAERLKGEDFEVDMGEIFKMLLVIEHRLKRLESAKDNNEEKIETDESVRDKLNKLVGNIINYYTICDCFPPKTHSLFTLSESEFGLSKYSWLENPPKVYIADNLTECYYIAVINGKIIEVGEAE